MTDPTPDVPDLPPRRPVSWRYRLFVTLAIAVAVGALVAGVRATEGDGDGAATVNGRPDVVEHLYPRDGAEVLRQVEIGIDLTAGYEAGLVVNDTPIPTEELRLVPEQNQVFFTPGPDKAVEELPPGLNCVTAVAWRSAEGPGANDLRFRWCFDVT